MAARHAQGLARCRAHALHRSLLDGLSERLLALLRFSAFTKCTSLRQCLLDRLQQHAQGLLYKLLSHGGLQQFLALLFLLGQLLGHHCHAGRVQ